jgi:hypothetical protein
MILPRQNLQDLRKIPKELKRRMTFVPVESMDEVCDAALDWGSGRRQAPLARVVAARTGHPAASAKQRD